MDGQDGVEVMLCMTSRVGGRFPQGRGLVRPSDPSHHPAALPRPGPFAAVPVLPHSVFCPSPAADTAAKGPAKGPTPQGKANTAVFVQYIIICDIGEY